MDNEAAGGPEEIPATFFLFFRITEQLSRVGLVDYVHKGGISGRSASPGRIEGFRLVPRHLVVDVTSLYIC